MKTRISLVLIAWSSFHFLGVCQDDSSSGFWKMMEPYFEEETIKNGAAYRMRFPDLEELPTHAKALATEQLVADWTAFDPKGAIDYSLERSDFHRIAAEAWYAAVHNPEEAAGLLRRIRPQNYHEKFEGALSEMVRQRGDFSIFALKHAGWIEDGPVSGYYEMNGGGPQEFSMVVEAFCREDPKKVHWIREHHPEYSDSLVLRGAIRARASKTADRYVHRVMGINTNFLFSPSPHEVELALSLLEEINPVEGMKRLEYSTGPGGLRTSFASVFGREWIDSDPGVFLHWLAEDNHIEWLCNVFKGHYVTVAVERLALESPEKARAVVSEIADPVTSLNGKVALFTWLEKEGHPEPLAFFNTSPGVVLPDDMVRRAIRGIYFNGPEKALLAVEKNPDRADQFSLVIGRSVTARPDLLERWLAVLPDSLKPLAITGFLSAKNIGDPQEAVRLIDEIPDGPQRDTAILHLARAWSAQVPDDAMAWVLTLPRGKGKDAAVREIRSRWQLFDPVNPARGR